MCEGLAADRLAKRNRESQGKLATVLSSKKSGTSNNEATESKRRITKSWADGTVKHESPPPVLRLAFRPKTGPEFFYVFFEVVGVQSKPSRNPDMGKPSIAYDLQSAVV